MHSTPARSHQLHFMRISLGPLNLRCRKETLYFTRNTITKVQYQKRCPHMGTCTGLKCAKITFNSLVEELLDANNYTGITYCSESCGGLGCSCGYPSSGCLFYRIYHVPVDDNIYEVFQCPSWFETISFQVELHGPKHRAHTFELKPYTTKQIANVSFEITSFTFTPISLLNQRFFTNNNSTALHPRHNDTIHDQTNCIIKDTCNCNPAEDSVNCYCTNNNVSRITQLQNTFPLANIRRTSIHIRPQQHTYHYYTGSIRTFNHTIKETTQEIQNFQCRILPRLFRCYNCVKGSVATLFCESDTERIIIYFYSSIRLASRKHVEHNAETYITIFELQGTLNYVNGFKPLWHYIHSWTRNTSTNTSFNIEFAFPDISHFLDTCKQFFI
ncbi:hypothetical protein COOONC_09182 [Cooperia oncophora]